MEMTAKMMMMISQVSLMELELKREPKPKVQMNKQLNPHQIRVSHQQIPKKHETMFHWNINKRSNICKYNSKWIRLKRWIEIHFTMFTVYYVNS